MLKANSWLSFSIPNVLLPHCCLKVACRSSTCSGQKPGSRPWLLTLASPNLTLTASTPESPGILSTLHLFLPRCLGLSRHSVFSCHHLLISPCFSSSAMIWKDWPLYSSPAHLRLAHTLHAQLLCPPPVFAHPRDTAMASPAAGARILALLFWVTFSLFLLLLKKHESKAQDLVAARVQSLKNTLEQNVTRSTKRMAGKSEAPNKFHWRCDWAWLL